MEIQAKMEQKVSMSWQLKDIYTSVVWSKIADQCADGKSLAWFFNKMHGRDGNGGHGEFTKDEKEKLRNALFDLSDRVRISAQKIL